LNVHGVNDVGQTLIHAAEPHVRELCDFEIELAIEKLKRHESLVDQIPTELINAGGRKIRCEVHKHISSIWNKGEWDDEWKE
jgi:hypothetical protein